MSALRRFFFTLALAATAAIAGSAAQAADAIRYVSTTGRNANACTLAAPCRTLQRAINLAPAGGEVRILDSGFYGNSATIRKSLTIAGNGFTVMLDVPIVVNDAGAVVTLRGLMLDGQGAVTTGIRVDAAAAVHVERCVVQGFSGVGIAATAQGVGLFVVDTVSRDNGGSGVSTNAARLTVDNSRFENNGQSGLTVLSSEATIRRSIASGNSTSGIIALLSSAEIASTAAVQNGSAGFSVQSSTMTIDASVASGNDAGVRLDSAATARISNSSFTRNATGMSISSGGLVETRANNTVRGNTTDVTGTLTPIGAL